MVLHPAVTIRYVVFVSSRPYELPVTPVLRWNRGGTAGPGAGGWPACSPGWAGTSKTAAKPPPAGGCEDGPPPSLKEGAGLLDYHVHSQHSVDAEGDVRDHCRQAVKQGLLDLGFSDHLDFDPRDAGYGFLSLDRYLDDVARCREEYAGRLHVRCGLEVGELHRYWPQVSRVLQKSAGRLDFVIGSVHWYGGTLLGGDRYRALTPRARYAPYFAEVLALVDHGGFQILGHLDLVSRYPIPGSPPVPEEHQEEIRAILGAMLRHGIVPEINVSGIRHGICSFLPPRPVLEWYRELGGNIVALGSDAHGPASVGAMIPQAVRLARDLGFGYLARFERLELSPLPLT
ncbi:MAG TPA: hypothetical protein DCM14_02795 [Clostridiales bacterium UBA8153]|nr:hypothetical protein [Clostridiales bacterium UBA8153]